MNRLLKSIGDFGLIISIESTDDREILPISSALKRAHVPLVLLPYSGSDVDDHLRSVNEGEDLFIGAQCLPSPDEIEKSYASGAHFALCDTFEGAGLQKLKDRGYDFFMRVKSTDEIKSAIKGGAAALIINCDSSNWDELVRHVTTKYHHPFFLEGELSKDKIRPWQLLPEFIAFISRLPSPSRDPLVVEREASSLLRKFLGISFRSLSLMEDSPRLAEGATLAALSGIPLFGGARRDCLEIETDDMDRTLAYLKWCSVFMDPLTAKMEGSRVLSTELYNDFLGWPIRLVAL